MVHPRPNLRLRAQAEVQEIVRREYPDNKDFTAQPSIPLGNGHIFVVKYRSGDDLRRYERYAYFDGRTIHVYQDLRLLAANFGKPAKQVVSIELYKLIALLIITLALLGILLTTMGNEKFATALIGLIGISIGYIAGDRATGVRASGTSRSAS